MTGLNRDQRLMPGTFGPEDYIDFYEDPFAALEDIQTAWRDKKPAEPWSARNLADIHIGGIDWHKYSPPVALRRAPNVTSQVLLDVLWSSVENVEARNNSEDRQRLEEEQKRLAESDADRKGKMKEPYLPIIIPHDIPVTQDSTATPRDSVISQPDSSLTTAPVNTSPVAKTRKRRAFILRRLFQRSNERGESSTAGAALELLRQDAEKAQRNTLTKGFSLSKSTPDELVECVSCLDDFHPKDVVKVTCHSYCHECFVRLISTSVQNEQQWPPKCCLNQIPFKIILRFIPGDLKTVFEERSQEWELPVSDRVYCSEPGCGMWIQPKRINAARRQGVCGQSHITCTICRGPSHSGDDCPQDNDMNLTNLLAEEEGWRRCYQCNALVEHREACQHMTCRCGSHFCYVCGLVWRTCGCTMEQLQELKDRSDERRAERQAREDSQAEELRQILLQIEEFEREVALKAELLRQEQERIEEERRQQELEERVRQESIRRRDIELKYGELRTQLDQLHELQQVLLDLDHEQETKDVIAQASAAKQELSEKQEAERSSRKSLAVVKMTEKEFNLNKDFQIRAAEEHEVEEAYHQQLETYWKDKKEGQDEIEAAMLVLRKRMDLRHYKWQKWKAEELKLFEAKLEESRALKEELLYSAEHRLNDACDEKEAEMMRRIAAEKKWLEMVILERERLLSEWEVQEVEDDADSLFAPDSENAVDTKQVVTATS